MPAGIRPLTPERIQLPRVAAILGYSLRTVQMMAAAGDLPSAVQRKPGSRWTFDETAIRCWLKQHEREMACPTIPTKISTQSETSGTSRSKSEDAKYARAYTQLISRRRGPAATSV